MTLLSVLTVIAGIGMVSESLGGLHGLPLAKLGTHLGGVLQARGLQAWVLLVEIRR